MKFQSRPMHPEHGFISQAHVTPILELRQPTRVVTVHPYLHPSIAWTPEQTPAPREVPSTDRTTPRKCAWPPCPIVFVPNASGPIKRYCEANCRAHARNAAMRVAPPPPRRVAVCTAGAP